jgi:hypothetical protein
VDPFHRELARIGLSAAAPYQFALAGGYAVAAHGLTDRASEDIDLFTTDQGGVLAARDLVVAAYEDAGYAVRVDLAGDTFARLYVTDPRTEREGKVELGVDWRARSPVMLDFGPVLHPDDAVAGKVNALFDRWEPRDFLDVDAAITSGRYTHEDLMRLISERNPGFTPEMFAGALSEFDHIDPADLTVYGVSTEEIASMRARFLGWRRSIEDHTGGSDVNGDPAVST